MKPAIGAALVALLLPASLGAQVLPQECLSARSRLEALTVLEGAVVIRGSARIGAVRGESGALVFVTAKEFSNAATGERVHGIAVELRSPDHAPQRPSYVDLEEIPALLAGLEHLTALERSATSLDELEADCRTRGGLLVTVFNTPAGPKASVACGCGGGSTDLELSDFLRFRQLLQSAFDRLRSIRGEEAK
jgi:hypothetical protein